MVGVGAYVTRYFRSVIKEFIRFVLKGNDALQIDRLLQVFEVYT